MTNRQKFAELDSREDEASTDPEGVQAEDEGGKDEEEPAKPDAKGEGPKYTDEDLDKLISRAIAKERKRAEKAVEEAKEKMTEAQKLEKMNDLERAKHEAEKQRKRADELEQKQNLAEQMKVARKELGEADITLPDELLSMFVSHEAEETGAAINKLKDLWPKAVRKAVSEALKREPPKNEGKGSLDVSLGAKKAEEMLAKVKNR